MSPCVFWMCFHRMSPVRATPSVPDCGRGHCVPPPAGSEPLGLFQEARFSTPPRPGQQAPGPRRTEVSPVTAEGLFSVFPLDPLPPRGGARSKMILSVQVGHHLCVLSSDEELSSSLHSEAIHPDPRLQLNVLVP